MGEEGHGLDEANKIMTVLTNADSVVDIQAEECDGQSTGAAREQDTGAEKGSCSGLCPIVPLNTAAGSEDQRHTAAAGNQDVSQHAANIRDESLKGDEAKENGDITTAPESQQDRSKCGSKQVVI